MSLQNKFKKTTPVAPQKASGGGANNYSLLKPGVTAYKFKNGSNLLRLVPQWKDSPFPNFLDVNVLSFFGDGLPIRGTFRVMEEHGWLLTRAYKLLRANPEFKHRLWSKQNELGVSFNTRPKVVFLGFDIEDPNREIVPIVLPGTVSYPAQDGKARIQQSGTRISQFSTDEDIHGNLRHGDIFDVESGKLIRLEVTNAGTIRAQYEPAVDATFPLTDRKFEPVLAQIQSFDDYVVEPSIKELVEVLSLYLPPDIYDYLDSQIRFDRVIAKETGEPIQRPVTQPTSPSTPYVEDNVPY